MPSKPKQHTAIISGVKRMQPKSESQAGKHYNAAWRKLRLQWLREHPLCALCGVYEHSAHVDHIVPLSEGGTDDPENLQTLCHRCHNQKTAEDMRQYGR